MTGQVEPKTQGPAPARINEVEHLLRRVGAWAARRPDVLGLALVGSYARGTDARTGAPPSDESDVDLVLLAGAPAAYVGDDDWAAELGAARVLAPAPWGSVTERRLVMPSGLEVEVGIATTSWATTTPVDPGTRAVVKNGFRILHDPVGLLRELGAACGT